MRQLRLAEAVGGSEPAFAIMMNQHGAAVRHERHEFPERQRFF
jgi:D-alanyl-D-alanine carboxypeptidase